MRRAASIFFLLLYLSVYTELHQVFKVPVFFIHYIEHKSKDSSLSLIDFVELHYFNNNHSDSQHGKLPFKGDDCHVVVISFALVPDTFFEFSIKQAFTDLVENSSPTQFISSNFHFSIWQPPKA